jgi:molybdenum cofactor biosynthesis enzyme MoaA
MATTALIDISNPTALTERNVLTDKGINDKKWTANQDKSIRSGRTLKQTSEIPTMLWEAIAKGNEKFILPIASVCGADCVFCFNKYNPMDMDLASGFRDLDDIQQAIELLGGDMPIHLGGESNGVVRQEGEPLLHPKIFEIMGMIRKKHPHTLVHIMTNATQLTEKFILKLLPFSPITFQISYHSNNQHNWCKILGIRAKKFLIAQNSFPLLQKYGIQCKTTIVAMPNLVGFDDIEGTISYLRQFTDIINIYSPHYTDAANAKDEEFRHGMSYDPIEMSEFLKRMRVKYNSNIDWPLDPLKPINLGGFHSNFMPANIMGDLMYRGWKHPLWLLSEAAWIRGAGKVIDEASPYFANEHSALCVKNTTYGGTITTAGLLMVDDYDKAIEKAFNEDFELRHKIDCFVLPALPFNRFGQDMVGKNYSLLQDKYGINVSCALQYPDGDFTGETTSSHDQWRPSKPASHMANVDPSTIEYETGDTPMATRKKA